MKILIIINVFISVRPPHPSGEADIWDEGIYVTGEEVAQAQECHEQHGRGRGHALDLDHSQDLWHLTLQRSSVEESAHKPSL